ncbi:MAG TPA: CDP-alcohol phosphatidyltransferase family protein, partial [Gemmataceae bacterium]|nr:CDP-alcohol phosphatidyltransferase family protein [Gemmataceae bacterium]
YLLALALILANRLADGFDGAVARRLGPTDLGGYLDILLDFLFYSGVPFFFAVGKPEFALPAAFLVFSFVGTGSSFLAFAVIAAKRGINTRARGRKSIYYLGGLTEGTETLALFVAICVLPDWFAVLAWAFGGMCWITTTGRIVAALAAFYDREGSNVPGTGWVESSRPTSLPSPQRQQGNAVVGLEDSAQPTAQGATNESR